MKDLAFIGDMFLEKLSNWRTFINANELKSCS
jgi:hypothetical protein